MSAHCQAEFQRWQSAPLPTLPIKRALHAAELVKEDELFSIDRGQASGRDRDERATGWF
jgi:hypothetical protein